MVASSNITPGMTLSIGSKLYRVESSVKVTVPKGTPFIKTQLKELSTGATIEKNFKTDQQVKDVALEERSLEFLYLEGKNYLCLDIDTLDQVIVPGTVIGDKTDYLKEGVHLTACFYGETVFSVELPQFLELQVSRAAEEKSTKFAILETGAKIEVPPFIEIGDIIKVDTKERQYIQRV